MAPTTQTSPLSSTAMVWTSARAPTRLLLTETPLTNSWNSSFTSTWTGTTTVSHIWPPSDMTRTRSFVSRLASLVKTSHGRDLAAKLKSPVYCELLGPINEVIDAALNQLLDAGTLANAGGGFLGKGAKMKKGDIHVSPGKWVTLDSLAAKSVTTSCRCLSRSPPTRCL